jgi:MFS-type transporter involved in bile tolerance (Atg22 family)
VLFATRIGAATIEIMSESHFFKIVKEEDVDEISFFRNTGPASFIVAPLVAIPVLLYTPSFEFIFFALSAILLLGLFITLRLKDVK